MLTELSGKSTKLTQSNNDVYTEFAIIVYTKSAAVAEMADRTSLSLIAV